MKIKKITAIDIGGKDISDIIKLEYKELDGVFACFASGACEGGFRGGESFVLTPDQAPMGVRTGSFYF